MSDEPLLVVDDIVSAYGKSIVLRGVSLTVDEGEVVALLGRNGVGKTTTLRTIAGVLHPRQGRIHFDGQDITEMPDPRISRRFLRRILSDDQRFRTEMPDYEISRRGISFVPENRAIFPDLTVEENLRMGSVSGKEGLLSVSEVYDILPRLEERRTFSGSDLSGGEQQMLAIARALVKETQLLMLDEPTEGLAVQIIDDVRELIEQIREMGVPILLVEQNFEVARRTADRAYVLHQGEVAFDGDMDVLVDSDQILERYLGVGVSG